MKKKTSIGKILLIVLGVIIAAALAIFAVFKIRTTIPELQGEPSVGKWYKITPAGTKSSDGSEWNGFIRLGTENKVVVYLFGGGVSLNEETAAGDFYTKTLQYQNLFVNIGIGNMTDENPFKDWTFLVLPYSTADWHAGAGEFPYTDADGKAQILYHNGYINDNLFMQEAMRYVDTPEAVVIAGFSAGGFGTALIGDDLITNYFPTVENVTVFADSSLLIWDGWRDTAENVWKSPENISEKLISENITLDLLCALSENHPNVKILFGCSVRDGALSMYQNYLDTGDFVATEAAGDIHQTHLSEMVRSVLEIPNSAVFIWDGIPYDKDSNLTQHTILDMEEFYSRDFNGTTVAVWLMDAVNGDLYSCGTELADKSY